MFTYGEQKKEIILVIETAVMRLTYLGGVDLADCVCLVGLHLSLDVDLKLLACCEGVILDLLLRDAFEVPPDLLVGVGHPHALLRVIGLLLLCLSDVFLHLQPWRRIRVGSWCLVWSDEIQISQNYVK